MRRRAFVAGNWKMNTNSSSSISLAQAIVDGCGDAAGQQVDVAVFPPFVYLQGVKKAIGGHGVALGAQDVYTQADGAYTGEISVAMLKDVGCTYVLCGHSERRHVIGETDGLINKKVHACLSGGLLPMLCVGELLEQRKSGQTEAVVEKQTREGMAGLGKEKAAAVTVAYEPVWAIGTGLTATPEQSQEVHGMIRGLLARMYDEELAQGIRILYGGSVKGDNAEQLLGQEDIDGLLVGGASLKAGEFLEIIKAGARKAEK